MSSCLSGRAYRLNLDLIKPPTTTFSTSNSSSPSSTLSESSNSPLSIFTRKPRTPRKRPNQTYNEAAAILFTAYPKLFPPKNLPKPFKLTKSHDNRGPFLSEPPDLLIPFHHRDKGCLLQRPPLPTAEKPCRSPGEVTSSRGDLLEICDEFEEDFDAESILDEEVEEGIDSIMGNPRAEGAAAEFRDSGVVGGGFCYGFPVGMGFDFGCGMMMKAMRNADGGDQWSSPRVNVVDIIAGAPAVKKAAKKKKKKLEDLSNSREESASPRPDAAGLRLNLDYDGVLSAWSGKGSPFAGDAEPAGNDVQARLAEIELFPENGVGSGPGRGAIVLRYKEKRRTRLFSKKIRYQVRKANADQRPRIKGRFVRMPNSADDD
ncbi:protein CHLOROPLAST IMPORT APPARATUS 2-like isoform X2 [Salvia miltiorrhiza]|uniref:protein CHLOROPLAST IMPORT APPARATUS 2-like isoform X2 n=1 Tax=Salvia miltiorrhiza TaxID=226208 RepID=UPI0025ABE423|nr:protein CHLOROPLAST IMPORT APPARATUS 2-like isoform X2 [Salvia miltiorrhiza]